MISNSQNWILENCKLLAKIFGTNNVYLDEIEFRYIKIYQFHLPAFWTPNRSTLLIELPVGSQIFSTAPNKFYLQKGLRVFNKIPEHYFESDYYNDLSAQGWARYSFHITNGWKPSMICKYGMTLVDILDALYERMDDAVMETLK